MLLLLFAKGHERHDSLFMVACRSPLRDQESVIYQLAALTFVKTDWSQLSQIDVAEIQLYHELVSLNDLFNLIKLLRNSKARDYYDSDQKKDYLSHIIGINFDLDQ